eukprot:2545891-Heterocapsa_arctica.AAC.1
MELVVWLENIIKAPEKGQMAENKKEEEKVLSTKEFYKAINLLKEMNEEAVRENKEEANMTRISLRDMGRTMTKRRERSQMPDTGKKGKKAKAEDETK